MHKFSSVQLYLSRVIQTGQQGSEADGSDEKGPSVEDESGMGSGFVTNRSEATDFEEGEPREKRSVEDASGEDASGEDASGEDASGEDASGEDASGEEASGEDGSSSESGMSSFFYTNLL